MASDSELFLLARTMPDHSISDPTESWRQNVGQMKVLLSWHIHAFYSALIPLNLINFEGYHGKKKIKDQPQRFG